jgi:hypothetical protein
VDDPEMWVGFPIADVRSINGEPLAAQLSASAAAPVHCVCLGEGFIRQINKVVGGPQPSLAGIEHYRE